MVTFLAVCKWITIKNWNWLLKEKFHWGLTTFLGLSKWYGLIAFVVMCFINNHFKKGFCWNAKGCKNITTPNCGANIGTWWCWQEMVHKK